MDDFFAVSPVIIDKYQGNVTEISGGLVLKNQIKPDKNNLSDRLIK